uniref:Tyrosine specific protein phosphatases domain-containing protein n=1 Tax=Setaria digitata TaxID=48799 RepID=A0A915Q0V7_9BILA
MLSSGCTCLDSACFTFVFNLTSKETSRRVLRELVKMYYVLAKAAIVEVSMNGHLSKSKSSHDYKRCLRQKKCNQRRLPDRWINYDPVGKDMKGTRFVAFKTPLRPNYFVNRSAGFDEQDIFETKTLLNMANAVGKKIGLVIDLTATDKYYDPHEWTDAGVKYDKIWCVGHRVHTQNENIQKFYSTVSDFLSRHIHTGELIGVHCTHGVNRTGYMICRYLIEVDGWDVDSAVKQFEYCRGYKIERKEYIDSLRNDCVSGKHSAMSVDYVGKCVLLDKIFDKQPEHLKNILPCIDLNEFIAST